MTSFTPRQRVLDLFKKVPIDTMPIFSGLSMLVQPALTACGLRFCEIHQDPEKMAFAAIRSAQMMEFDSVVVPFDITMLSEAAGNRVNFYESADEIVFPTVPEKIWRSLDDIHLPTDITAKGRLPMVARAIEIVKNEAPDYPVGTWLRGPFTQLGQLLELESVLKAVFKTPDKVKGVMARLSDITIDLGRAWLAAGADYITLSEPGANAEVLPPRIFKKAIMPWLQKILAAWDAPRVLHISGVSDPLVEMMTACGADAIGVDIKNNLVETRQKIGSDTLLFGNFDVYQLPCDADTTAREAAAAIRANIDAGVDAVWPGSDLWPAVKPENMRAIVGTVHTYGRKPSPAVTRC